MSKLSAYLRLMRFSALPTLLADVLMAYLLAAGAWLPLWQLALLLVCSSCFYLAGMVLNDLTDIAHDREHCPERVLTAGEISLANARLLCAGLTTTALVIAGGLTVVQIQRGENGWQLPIGLCLAGFIAIYNLRAKRTAFGPLFMGGCRFLNILLVSSVHVAGKNLVAGFEKDQLLVAAAIGIYVAGITWFGRSEHGASRRGQLIAGAVVMAAGVGLLFWLPFTDFFDGMTSDRDPVPDRNKWLFCGLLAMMLFPVIRRVAVAIASCDSGDVKSAVIISLLTIIMIDASICYLVSPETPAYALIVAALLIPAVLMGRRISAT